MAMRIGDWAESSGGFFAGEEINTRSMLSSSSKPGMAGMAPAVSHFSRIIAPARDDRIRAQSMPINAPAFGSTNRQSAGSDCPFAAMGASRAARAIIARRRGMLREVSVELGGRCRTYRRGRNFGEY